MFSRLQKRCKLAKVDVASSSLVTRSLFVVEGVPHFRASNYKQNYKRSRRFLIRSGDVFDVSGQSSEDVGDEFRSVRRFGKQLLDETEICILVQTAPSGESNRRTSRSPKPNEVSRTSLRAESRSGQSRSSAVPSRAQGRFPALATMKPSKTEKSVRVETETVLPGTELSTQASLGDYELKKEQATLPRTHTRRTGRKIAACSDQLSDREIASLYEQLAPLVGLARLLKGEPPGTSPRIGRHHTGDFTVRRDCDDTRLFRRDLPSNSPRRRPRQEPGGGPLPNYRV